jgi:hypothetical protein
VTHEIGLAYARATALDFEVAKSRDVDFDRQRAKSDVAGDEKREKKEKKVAGSKTK